MGKKKTATEKKRDRAMRASKARTAAEEKRKIKEKVVPFKVKRIRMLMSVANEKVAFDSGGIYKVGVDITPESAASYIRTGVAEEDTSLKVPEEIKAVPEVEVPKEEIEEEPKEESEEESEEEEETAEAPVPEEPEGSEIPPEKE